MCGISPKCQKIFKMKISSSLLVLAVLYCSTLGAKLPSDFKICKRSELTHPSECFKSAIQHALPLVRNGLPDLKIGKLEPLVVESATIGEGKGAVNVAQNYKNFQIHGISHSTVDNVDFKIADDKKSFTIDVTVHNREYRFESDYSMNGRVLLLPIVGDGQCIITGKNTTVEFHISGEFYKNNEQEFIKATKIDVKIIPEQVTYYFGNLFNGDKVLGDQINTLLNDNWKEIFDDVGKGYETVVASVVLNYVNSVFRKFSFDELFPN